MITQDDIDAMSDDDSKGAVIITLGSGVEFSMRNGLMFMEHGKDKSICLGLDTIDNFNRLIKNMERLKIHATT